MNYNKIKLYWKTKLLKGGCRLNIFLSYDCNFNCWYCPVRMYLNKKVDPCSFDEWIDLFKRFPVRVREVNFSGGEPTLSTIFLPLVNYLLLNGYHVQVQTNLTKPEVLMQIPKNYRFSIIATYHHHDSKDRFLKAYKMIYQRHRIDVDEINDEINQVLPFSNYKPLVRKGQWERINFMISPNQHIFIGCEDHFLKMSK